jgi:hypothetical protein
MFHEENKPTKTTLVSFITQKNSIVENNNKNYA